jgi:hypothetical protein
MTIKEIVTSRCPGARCRQCIAGWEVVSEGKVIGTGRSAKIAWGQAEYNTRHCDVSPNILITALRL